MTKPAIAVQNLAVVKDNRRIVDNASFVLEHGSAIAIVGHSGSGKTTLLRALAGLERIAEGYVEIEGESVAHFTERDWVRVRRKLGLVLDKNTLLHDLTLEENIVFPLVQMNIPETDIEARLEHSLVNLDIYDWREAEVSDLSPTLVRRGLLARALILEPEILLFDSPFDGLDPVAREDLRQDLTRLVSRRGVALLFTCHDPAHAKGLAGSELVLESGLIRKGAVLP
jgi:ABC-type sulfate/molybdate transport systems ATPase subunit